VFYFSLIFKNRVFIPFNLYLLCLADMIKYKYQVEKYGKLLYLNINSQFSALFFFIPELLLLLKGFYLLFDFYNIFYTVLGFIVGA
jgi:hypothetical protein